MTIPILQPPEPKKLHARELVIATRLPKLDASRYTGAFAGPDDVTLTCDVVDDKGKRCGWHVWGPRKEAKLAADEHRKLFHPEEIGVVLLNQPRQ